MRILQRLGLILLASSSLAGCSLIETVKEGLTAKSQIEELLTPMETTPECLADGVPLTPPDPVDFDIMPIDTTYNRISNETLGEVIAWVCCLEALSDEHSICNESN